MGVGNEGTTDADYKQGSIFISTYKVGKRIDGESEITWSEAELAKALGHPVGLDRAQAGLEQVRRQRL